MMILMSVQCSAHAELDANSHSALESTKSLLTTPTERQKAISQDPKARDVDKKVDALAGGSENKEDIYKLAAEIMDKIVQETNGDPEKMKQMMHEAESNPKAFYEKMFSAEQKAKARAVANKIEKRPVESSSPGK